MNDMSVAPLGTARSSAPATQVGGTQAGAAVNEAARALTTTVGVFLGVGAVGIVGIAAITGVANLYKLSPAAVDRLASVLLFGAMPIGGIAGGILGWTMPTHR